MVTKLLPFTGWFKNYKGAQLKADAVAGLTVALVLIPQSMAYAQLAGLPAYYGLYASFLPPLVAALFGSSRQLSTGPVAVVSLMTAASLEPLAAAGSASFIAYAILLSLIVGLFQFLLGALRLGVVVNFLSHPVVIGFTNAAAIIIASSQISKLFGVYVDKGDHHYETVFRMFEAATHYTHWPTLALGCGALIFMLVLKKVAPRFPGVLVAVTLAIILSFVIGFEHKRSANINEIRSPFAKDIIWEFSIQSALLENLIKERIETYQKLPGLKKFYPDWIDTMREIDLISHRIRVAQGKVTKHRGQVRKMLLSRITAGREAGYYLQADVPDEIPTDGRIWRVKVGSKPLNTANLGMIGGGAVIGHVPKGLPAIRIPVLDIHTFKTLLSYAIIIAILGFMEAISIAKAMAAKTGTRLDPNQELIGQGLGNIVGAFGQSYPTSGSFSRSAVNLQAGALTGISSVITSFTVVVVLLFFTPLLYHLPQSVLAAVIILAVIGLVNVKGFVHAWKAQWYDGLIAIITFVCTLYFAPHLDIGIIIGVVLSLVVFLYKSMRPNVVSLSRGEDESLHAALSHGLEECKYIDMIRFEGPLFFANASFLEDQIINHMETKPELKHIIIESSSIDILDASGEEALSLIVDRVRNAGIEISFSGVHREVMDVLTRTGMIKKIGINHFFPNIEKALNAVYADAHKENTETGGCPLKAVIYAEEEIRQNNILDKIQPWKLRHN
jgi:MFS superfamily sulfate permease-like transporter